MAPTTTLTYTHSQSSIYVSDKMRTLLKNLLVRSGQDPQELLQAWNDWVERAVRTWLESKHLLMIIIEFHEPGKSIASGRWDFPIRYGTNDIDEMWTDRKFFEETISKADRPPATALYRIVLRTREGQPDVDGVGPTKLLDTSGLTAREAGTVIATPHMTASARYYK